MARPGKAPAFQFYPRDYLCDLNVRGMSYEQRGVYWELVSLCWLEQGIPSDLNAIAKILGMKHSRLVKLWPGIAPCFVVDGDRLQHPRLNAERLEQEQFAASKSVAGKAGNDKRWGSQSDRKPSQSDTPAIANHRSASASASSTASAREVIGTERTALVPAPRVVADANFAIFWQAYPRKAAKGDAEKAWRKLAPSPELQARILAAIQQQRTSTDWLRDGGQYIPYPASWLNAQRWTDEAVDVPIMSAQTLRLAQSTAEFLRS
jgi:uncharacterized protein YdaU (DUF1376 family)